MSDPIKNRYEFVVLFDVENGNPNGDPDAGNMPRVDPETGYGLVTDVCLKRKIRNYVEMAKEDADHYHIYIKDGVPLNSSDKEACAYVGADPDKLKEAKKKDEHLDEKIRDFMCSNFYDIRTFGAVMTTFTKGALNCGQVRGPVQLGFARSIDPILPQEVTITRVAITTEADAEKKNTEMGRKYIVPYGLYRAEGYVSANLARKTTGFSEEDLELLWTAILNMFENDHSAAARRAFRSKAARACGSPIPWSISAESRKRARKTRSSSVDRRCALKKCSAARSRAARSITASRGGARKSTSPPRCGRRCVPSLKRCMRSTCAAARRR